MLMLLVWGPHTEAHCSYGRNRHSVDEDTLFLLMCKVMWFWLLPSSLGMFSTPSLNSVSSYHGALHPHLKWTILRMGTSPAHMQFFLTINLIAQPLPHRHLQYPNCPVNPCVISTGKPLVYIRFSSLMLPQNTSFPVQHLFQLIITHSRVWYVD